MSYNSCKSGGGTRGPSLVWAKTFAEGSDGFRPGRAAHQALARAHAYLEEGSSGVGDLDLEKFFDRVQQDQRMSLGKERMPDRRVLQRIARYLQARALPGAGGAATTERPPHGGPLSPLLANLLLDGFDKERERRGHRFVRDAADSYLYVNSARAGPGVLASVTRFFARRLQRTVQATNRAVDRPGRRTFLCCTFTGRWPHRRRVRATALQTGKQEVRQRPSRTRGITLRRLAPALRQSLEGWYAYLRSAEAQSMFTELDSWGRRRLRCYGWKSWGRRRSRELRKHGGSQERAWNTGKSAPGRGA